MLSNKLIYQKLKKLIIDQHQYEFFPKDGNLSNSEKIKQTNEEIARKSKISLLEEILELI